MSKRLLLILSLSLIGSCDTSNNSKIEKIVPLYQSCLQYFEDYKKIAKDGYQVQLIKRLFSNEHIYPAHPGLIGFVEIISTGDAKNIDIVENGFELLCFPKHSMTTDADELGLRILKETLSKNLASGKIENYIVISNGQLTIHFNNTADEMKTGITNQ